MALAVLAVVALAGCASTQARSDRQQAQLAAVEAAAGAPVNSFRYDARSMYAWQSLNDHQLLIYTQPHKAWLLDVGYCPDLPYTPSIGVTSHVGVVSRNVDGVVLNGGGYVCDIQKIQPVDVSQLREQMHAREGAKVVLEPATSGS